MIVSMYARSFSGLLFGLLASEAMFAVTFGAATIVCAIGLFGSHHCHGLASSIVPGIWAGQSGVTSGNKPSTPVLMLTVDPVCTWVVPYVARARSVKGSPSGKFANDALLP